MPSAPRTGCLRPTAYCAWCSAASGHQVLGHGQETCAGPAHVEQLTAQVGQAAHADRRSQQEQYARRTALDAAHQARKPRITAIGSVRAVGHVVHVDGWTFVDPLRADIAPRQVSTTGPTEEAFSWTADELHTIAHGGRCPCPVTALLARR